MCDMKFILHVYDLTAVSGSRGDGDRALTAVPDFVLTSLTNVELLDVLDKGRRCFNICSGYL